MEEKNKITIESIEDAKLDDLFTILNDDLRRIVKKISDGLLEASIKKIQSERDRMISIIRNCQNIEEDIKNLLIKDIGTSDSKDKY